MGGVIGGVSSAMGEWANSFIGSYFGASFNNIANIPLRETLQGAAGGLLAGSTMGALMYSFNGAKGSFWDNVLMNAAMGTIMGATSGYIKGVELQKQVRLQKNLAEAQPQKKAQVHHFATNKNNKYTKLIKRYTDKYGLDLDDSQNKESLPHGGRHANEYHRWVLKQIDMIDQMSNGDQQLFLKYFENYVKQPVRNNPSILYKDYWLSVKYMGQ